MVKKSFYEIEENFLSRIKTQPIRVNLEKQNKLSFEAIQDLKQGEFDETLNE